MNIVSVNKNQIFYCFFIGLPLVTEKNKVIMSVKSLQTAIDKINNK